MDLLRCPKCTMAFTSLHLLEKHKEKFCIGEVIGKTSQNATLTDVVERMRDHGRRRQERREQQRLESEWLLGPQDLDMKPQAQATEAAHVRKPNSEPAPTSTLTGLRFSATWRRGREAQMRELTERRWKHVACLENENKQLEEQKRDVDVRLQEIATQTKSVSRLEKMLREVQAQEQRNAILLESLVSQLQRFQIASIRERTWSRHSNSQLSFVKRKEKDSTHTYTYIPLYDSGTLSSEISALQLSYLQSGGNDHLILVQLQNLLKEALEMEEHLRKQVHDSPHYRDKMKRGQDIANDQVRRDLITMELKNQHLEEEIMRNELKKLRDSRLIKMTYNSLTNEQRMKAMKMEIDLLKQEMEIQGLRRRIKATTVPLLLSHLPSLEDARSSSQGRGKHFQQVPDGFGPTPYDPISGFVVFYDFLLGLSPSYRACRLVMRLYGEDQEIGSPSPLPVVYCEPASLSLHIPDHRRGNLASLASKQAVPRLLPSPSISLVLELQASGGYDPFGEEVTRLLSRGWVKAAVFDSHSRLLSGKWKIPVRIPPVRPSMTTGELNAVPQLDNAELYLRIVSAQDAEVQGSAPISHSNWRLYKYPPPQTQGTDVAVADSLLSPRSSRFSHS